MKTSLTLHTFSWCINPTYLYVTLSIHHPHANATEQTKQSIVIYNRMCPIHTWTVICVTFFTKPRIRCSIKLKQTRTLYNVKYRITTGTRIFSPVPVDSSIFKQISDRGQEKRATHTLALTCPTTSARNL